MDYLTQIDKDYKWVLLTASLMLFHFTVTGFFAGARRSKTFNQEFMDEHFKGTHERFFPGDKVPKGGYPDMGQGRYSEKLDYKTWFEFNVAQRIHYNYLESVTSVVTWLMIGGLMYAWYAVAAGSVYMIARIIYHIGYSLKGPQGRLIGFLLERLSSIALVVLSVISPLKMAGVI